MLTLRSPAKVNLFLRVKARRADGYHELASLFQTVDLFDTLHISLANNDTLSCTDPQIPVDPTNLVWKAIEAFRKHTGIVRHVSMHLEKKIPVQAGLGGGSGNAATALWGMNELCGRPLRESALLSLSAEVGSDVPFFFSDGSAFCTGRGEIVQSVALPGPLSFLLVKPPYGLSTPQVFRVLNLDLLENRDPESALHIFLSGKTEFFNDLEQSAYCVAPELAALRESLFHSGFSDVVMTGSGSCLCCYGQGHAPTDPALAVFSVRSVNRSTDSWNWVGCRDSHM